MTEPTIEDLDGKGGRAASVHFAPGQRIAHVYIPVLHKQWRVPADSGGAEITMQLVAATATDAAPSADGLAGSFDWSSVKAVPDLVSLGPVAQATIRLVDIESYPMGHIIGRHEVAREKLNKRMSKEAQAERANSRVRQPERSTSAGTVGLSPGAVSAATPDDPSSATDREINPAVRVKWTTAVAEMSKAKGLNSPGNDDSSQVEDNVFWTFAREVKENEGENGGAPLVNGARVQEVAKAVEQESKVLSE